MKRFLALLATLFLVFTGAVYAADEGREVKITSLGVDEVHEGEYIAVGEVMELSGTVNGDVYVAGGQVFIDGVVNGDLMVAGGQVIFSGVVTEDLRVAGGTVTVGGEVGGNVTALGGNIDFVSSATLGDGLVGAGGNITVAADVPGNVNLAGGNVVIASDVGGNTTVATEMVRLTSGASVEGTLTYYSSSEANIDASATVAGEIIQKQPPQMPEWQTDKDQIEGFFTGLSIAFGIVSMSSTFILGMLVVRFYPNFVKRNVENVSKRPFFSLLIGFTGFVMVPITAVMLMFTLLAIPFSLFTLVMYGVVLYLTRIFVMALLGKLIFKLVKVKSRLGFEFTAGMVFYYLLVLIPFVGPLVKFFVVIAGVGGFLISYRQTYLSARAKNIV